MVTIRSTATRVATGVLAAMLVAALPSCTPRPDGPTPAAEAFFAQLATGNTTAAADLSDRPEAYEDVGRLCRWGMVLPALQSLPYIIPRPEKNLLVQIIKPLKLLSARQSMK